MKKSAKKQQVAGSRRLGKVMVLGVAILLIWQIAQIMTVRTVGMPGVFTIPVNLLGGPRNVEVASAPGGTTTIYKRVPSPQERPTPAPPPQENARVQSPPPVLNPAPEPAAPEVPKGVERAAPAPQVLTRPETAQPPAPAPAAPQRPNVAAVPPPAAAPAPSGPAQLPSQSDVEGWIRSQAREFVGGVDADGLPLYRFDVWLDVPTNVGARIRTVNYEYIAPSAQPPAQVGNDKGTGFRVKFAGAACAEKLIVTVVMDDGRERKVEVDGCAVLN
ncbi:MAG: hypothetical protein AB7U38_02740 [Hyphomicrobiales bacterium]